MVLQRNKDIPVWGHSDAREMITVTIGTQKVVTTADATGSWLLHLGPIEAGGPYILTVQGNNTITFKDVLVGDVWVCSGQSNMAWSVKRSNNAAEEIASAQHPKIRFFGVKRTAAQMPQQDVKGAWAVCDSQSVANFSAVGYFFGRRLHKTLNVPIGLINTSWGGTPVEAWTSLPALQATSDYAPLHQRWTKRIANHPKAKAKFKVDLEKWKIASDSLKALGQKVPRRPRTPQAPNHPHRPSVLYNGMIAPLIPYAIQGAIWYQGESNAGRAYQYRTLFPTMIHNWRADWGQGAFPFLFVQLANYRKIEENPVESNWAELREAQQMALSLPNTGQAVIIDIGETDNIHPKNKQDVGLRLALAAEAQVYGKNNPFSGPIYKSMQIENDKIRITFDHSNGGLKKKGKALTGFAIAGVDKKFVWADATIEGNSVIVSSREIINPVAVRYAWANNPICNLYNGANLPASPFRTDTWPGITANKR
ncbi:MAG: sialate O-acetylesterase [Candidatus Latescibacteria bacterium]|nr:sialate O-acetylesterase [Candidatus Latescibacterota bacterium]MBT4139446.1 sialate O-acetylesterase [Candidatus Latescibacterota bacterium]MBT5832273.1 sialate O-acetylesterase [Candidatus Latescibacterota bacterium]